MNPQTYALLGLSVMVGALAAVLTFAVLKLISAARTSANQPRPALETAMLSSALEEALVKLKAQERATATRAEASERLSGGIIDSLTAGLIVVGLDGAIRILNPAARRMLRIPESAALSDYRSLVGEGALSDVIAECLTTRTAVIRRAVHLAGANRETAHLGVTVSPLVDPQGELDGAICLFSDLTGVKRLEEQLRLKENLATVGELTAGIAHEFRNGLATIHGYGQLLHLEVLPDAYRPYVEGIRAETRSLGQIVTNFLNFARPAELTLSNVDLRAICEHAAEEIRGEARTFDGEIHVGGEFGVIDGDEVLLRQVFSNLLRNAVEACSAASVTPRIVIESSIDSDCQLSRIRVDDNGPGIDPAERERVFQPFYTLKRDGTGLGLALVRKIVVFHNGRVDIGESPLGGASLQITLPVVS